MVKATTENPLAGIKTRIATMNPRDLVLLRTNARFMRHEQFQQLVSNIRRDGALTSVPLAAVMADGRYEVLSGNHRTQAAIEVGLEAIDVMLIDQELTKEQRVAIQLSHNAIAGQDDPAILKALYEELDEIDWRMYAGLDDKMLGLLDQVQPGALTEVNLEFQSLSIVFLPEELDRVLDVAGRALELARTGDATWIAKYGSHDRLLEAFTKISQSYGVTNTATVMDLLLDIFESHEHEIVEGWWDSVADTTKHNKYVPLTPVVGTAAPAESLAVVRKAIERAKHGNGSVPSWKALEHIAAAYLAAE